MVYPNSSVFFSLFWDNEFHDQKRDRLQFISIYLIIMLKAKKKMFSWKAVRKNPLRYHSFQQKKTNKKNVNNFQTLSSIF